MQEIEAFVREHGLNISSSEIELDSKYHSIRDPNTGKKMWYIGERLNGKIILTLGDWRTREKWNLKLGFEDTPEDRKLLAQRQEALARERENQAETASRAAQDIWEHDTIDGVVSEYIKKKKLEGAGDLGCKTQATGHGVDLIVPMYNEHGKLCNLQFIQPGGEKSFLPGGKTQGVSFELVPPTKLPDTLGTHQDAPIYIAEGLSTIATCAMALNWNGRFVCAFSAENLLKTAEIYRNRHQNAPILICGDDDWGLTKRAKPLPNAGREKANAAAEFVLGVTVFPKFPAPRDVRWTDWHDLYMVSSLKNVTDQLIKASAEALALKPSQPETTLQREPGNAITAIVEADVAREAKSSATPSAQAPGAATPAPKKSERLSPAEKKAQGIRELEMTRKSIPSWVNGVKALEWRVSPQGKLLPPEEQEVAKALYDYYHGRIGAFDKSIFLYRDTNWAEAGVQEENYFLQQIQLLYSGRASYQKARSMLLLFKALIPQFERSPFIPNPTIVNFRNGTLHIKGNTTEFLPHAPENLCLYTIPYNYEPESNDINSEFTEMLKRLLGVTDLKSDRVQVIKEMYGAALAPVYPHLFMLHGPGGSGKTSLILPIQKLLDPRAWCAVGPDEFTGFALGSMVGKTVNIVTDINLREPIEDSIIKQIEDRIPVRMDRKFKDPVLAPLPAVHIFGGNDLPPTYEKGSGAHRRRWTFIKIDSFQAEDGKYEKFYSNRIMESGAQGIVNFAVQGLLDLVARGGHYTVPEASRLEMRRWEMENDRVALFLEDLENGEVRDLELSTEGRMERVAFWEVFCAWHKESYRTEPKLGKIKFFKAVFEGRQSRAKFDLKKSNGSIMVHGVRERGVASKF